MVTGKGLQCGGVPVHSVQLPDFSLVTTKPLQPGIHEPMAGTLVLRPARPDPRCGRAQPSIQWKVTQPAP